MTPVSPRAAVVLWLALAAILFAAAWGVSLLEPESSTRSADRAAALGGARPVVVGGLFLRAEALRREGRVDELPAIYRRILELDPGSERAIDHLAEALARDLRTTATTAEGRASWWVEAESLVRAGLAHSPTSVRLLWRHADLLLVVGDMDPAVAAHLAASGRDREAEAVARLRDAARLSDAVPALGRIHLVLLAAYLPRLAAQRLARPGGAADARPFLATGAEVLGWRRAELSEMQWGDGPGSPSAYVVMQAGLALVAAVADALGASPPDRARAREIVDQYARQAGESPLVTALRPLVR